MTEAATPEAVKEPTKKEAAAIEAALYLSVRMSPALAAATAGKFHAVIPMLADVGEHVVKVGHRLFLREWTAVPTGRADIVRVLAVDASGITIERTWGWHQGKIDDNLDDLGLKMIPNLFPKVGF